MLFTYASKVQIQIGRDVAKGRRDSRSSLGVLKSQVTLGWNRGPRGAKAHVGQSQVGGERGSREAKKSRQDNP